MFPVLFHEVILTTKKRGKRLTSSLYTCQNLYALEDVLALHPTKRIIGCLVDVSFPS